MWLPSALYTPEEEPKPKVNGQQSCSSAANTPTQLTLSSASTQQFMSPPPLAQNPPPPSVVHSEPSLLSLINDSPPPQSSNMNEQGDQLLNSSNNTDPILSGEPQFPPPPPSHTQPSSQVKSVKSEKSQIQRKPPSFRLHVIKDTTKSLDARYQVVSEWTKVGGVLLMGYEMFRMLTTPKKQARVHSMPSMNPFMYAGVSGGFGNIPMSASATSLFQPPSNPPPSVVSETGSKKRKRPIMIDIDKEEKEEHMLKGRKI